MGLDGRVCAVTGAGSGIGRTVARIRNSVYLQGTRVLYRDLLGIDMVISPEIVTALKISNIATTPGASEVENFANGKIRKLEVATGITESISDYTDVFGATWGVGGDILICNKWYAPLLRVPPGGGDPIPVVAPADGYVFMWPSFLPDGKHFLYHARPYSTAGTGEIHLGSIDESRSSPLFEAISNAQFAAPETVVWWHDGNLRAQRLNPTRLTLEGEPTVVAAGVHFDPRTGSAGFSVSSNGMLIYQGGEVVRGDELVSGLETGYPGFEAKDACLVSAQAHIGVWRERCAGDAAIAFRGFARAGWRKWRQLRGGRHCGLWAVPLELCRVWA